MQAPYQLLSRVYDAGWADFSIQYQPLIEEELQARGIRAARVLDLGCGTGVLALALARSGHTVRGVDSSLPMLRVARRNARGVPGVRFVRGDLLDPQPGGPYDVVVCAYDALNYIRRLVDVRRLFRNVAASLREGGLFFFDSATVTMYRHQSGATAIREVGGLTILEDTSYDARYKLATTTFSFPDGTCEVHRQRPYSFDELSPILEANNLRATDRFSWFSRLPATPRSPKVFVIAEKDTIELERPAPWQTSSCTARPGARTAPGPSASWSATTSPTPGST